MGSQVLLRKFDPVYRQLTSLVSATTNYYCYELNLHSPGQHGQLDPSGSCQHPRDKSSSKLRCAFTSSLAGTLPLTPSSSLRKSFEREYTIRYIGRNTVLLLLVSLRITWRQSPSEFSYS